MRVVFSTQAQVDEWLAEVGFTLDDGKWYWTADTARASYFNMTHDSGTSNAKYTGSDGTAYTLKSGSWAYWGVDYYPLINGGMAFRFAPLSSPSASIDEVLHFAIVAKEDGSGFVYFIANSNILYDDLGGTLVNPSRWTATNIGNTQSIAIVVKMFNNVDSFIDAHARTVLAAQNVAASINFTFECGGKKYLSGMFTATSATKLGQIVFEVAS